MRFFFFFVLCFPLFLQGNSDTLYTISHDPGFYKTGFELVLKNEHGDIFYNTGGKLANRSSRKIKKPIKITKTTNLNIAVYVDKKLVHRESLTYFIDFKTDFPVFSIYVDPSDLWSERRGIYVKGVNAIWDSVRGYWRNANYFKKWEKDVFVEFFELDKERVISQNSGLRLFGGLSRQLKDKSLRLVARSEYGSSRFKHNFFQNNHKKYKNLVLRTSGGDYNKSRFKDVFITQLAREIDIPTQEARPSLLFVNGDYWGVYNIREKIDERYLERNFDADESDLDLLQGRMVVEHGDKIEYQNMLNFVKQNDLKETANYDILKTMMDVQNYQDYIITQLYISNKDSRGNVRFWKHPKKGGKFKWILYDTDLSFGTGLHPSFNFFKKLISPTETDWYNPEWSTFLLRNLLKNDDFRIDFFNRICFLLSTTYSPGNVISKIDYYAEIYRPEMSRHFDSKPGTFRNWEKYVEKFKSFANDRPSYFLKNVASEFEYQNPYNLIIHNNFKNAGIIKIDDIEIKQDTFKGVFYKENFLTIEAISKIKYNFVGWGNIEGSSKLILNQNNVKSDKLILKPLFEIQPLHQLSDSVFINEMSFSIEDDKKLSWFEVFNSSSQDIVFSDLKIIHHNNIYNIDNFEIKASDYNIICNDTSLFKMIFEEEVNIYELNIDFQDYQLIEMVHDNNLLDSLSFNFENKFSVSLDNPFYVNSDYSNWTLSDATPGFINQEYFEYLEEEERLFLAKKLALKKKKRKKRILYGATISSVAGSVIYFIVH